MNETNTRSTPEGMTLEQVGATLRQLVAEGNFSHHRIGVLYNYVVDNELAEQNGFKDAPAYFREHVKPLEDVERMVEALMDGLQPVHAVA